MKMFGFPVAFLVLTFIRASTSLKDPNAKGVCPLVPRLPDSMCAGRTFSECWNPGHPDVDCANNGLCCFDGCAHSCPASDFSPEPATVQPALPIYEFPDVPVVDQPTVEPSLELNPKPVIPLYVPVTLVVDNDVSTKPGTHVEATEEPVGQPDFEDVYDAIPDDVEIGEVTEENIDDESVEPATTASITQTAQNSGCQVLNSSCEESVLPSNCVYADTVDCHLDCHYVEKPVVLEGEEKCCRTVPYLACSSQCVAVPALYHENVSERTNCTVNPILDGTKKCSVNRKKVCHYVDETVCDGPAKECVEWKDKAGCAPREVCHYKLVPGCDNPGRDGGCVKKICKVMTSFGCYPGGCSSACETKRVKKCAYVTVEECANVTLDCVTNNVTSYDEIVDTCSGEGRFCSREEKTTCVTEPIKVNAVDYVRKCEKVCVPTNKTVCSDVFVPALFCERFSDCGGKPEVAIDLTAKW